MGILASTIFQFEPKHPVDTIACQLIMIVIFLILIFLSLSTYKLVQFLQKSCAPPSVVFCNKCKKCAFYFCYYIYTMPISSLFLFSIFEHIYVNQSKFSKYSCYILKLKNIPSILYIFFEKFLPYQNREGVNETLKFFNQAQK